MSDDSAATRGPDLRAGYPEDRLKDHGMVLGHVDGEPVLLVRRGAVVFAVGATCTHYGAFLADGIVVGDTVRCPLHHACFDLQTGEAIRAPALQPLPRYEVERRLDLLVVRGRLERPRPVAHSAYPRHGREPKRIVIVGAGAAGSAAALTLRQEGFVGQLTLIGEESSEPYDRPNLSKDFLAGNASEEWLPLVPQSVYEENGIRLALGTPVARIDPAAWTVWLSDGRAFPFDALLLATGATPRALPVPGADQERVHYLRTLADCRAIIARAAAAGSAVVIGTGFMGLETAAALRQRGLEVHVVGPDQRPLERVLGAELGGYLQRLHESRGVVFHLGRSAAEITADSVRLDDGSAIRAGLVVVAIGVQPNTALAARAGLVLNQGVLVDHHLETSTRGIFAAGDIARWPDARSGEPVRFEHWATAERQGQTAARNMLGRMERFDAIPFFWTQHFDVRVSYVGRAQTWDRLEVKPGLPEGDWEQRYFRDGTLLAVATVGRDRESLAAELGLEQKFVAAPTARAARGAKVPSGNPR
jgi:NADPH-dependent 2,4-dienoyl-CoA reductase/sulfur reductase-like enzyme/nitrite reductase/ring-hydroxylating ferredoxin subunit